MYVLTLIRSQCCQINGFLDVANILNDLKDIDVQIIPHANNAANECLNVGVAICLHPKPQFLQWFFVVYCANAISSLRMVENGRCRMSCSMTYGLFKVMESIYGLYFDQTPLKTVESINS